jgi:SAM-dependent methyltransferase
METSAQAQAPRSFSDRAGVAVFERNAARYDRWFEDHAPTFAAELEALRQLLPPFQRGLEIGVGSGRFALPLGIKEGVEPAEAMAAIAERRGLEVSRAVAEELPFADSSFDLVLMVTVLCFLDDPRRALREAHRILKPGGSILIGMIDPASTLGRDYEANKATSTFYAPARFHAPEEVIAWLQQCGFDQVRCRQAALPGCDGVPFMAVRARA